MIEKRLSELLKKYVHIFIQEYIDFLSKDQLELLRSINYDNVIEFNHVNNPFGVTNLDKICFSNVSDELIANLKNMPNYNKTHSDLHNKNLSSYIKYMCDNGYDVINYYEDILMYFVFFFVIKNTSGLVYGLINQEINYLSIKYSLKCASLFAREENIVAKLTPFLKMEGSRKLLFMDRVSAFKYLNDTLGFRHAKLVDDISIMIDEEYKKLKNKEYNGYSGLLDWTDAYDHLSYGDVYNRILDFEVENSFIH